MTTTLTLPRRAGPKPQTTPTNPHTQLDQIAPIELQQAVAEHMFALECVDERPSKISVPGARAAWLRESCRAGAPSAFLVEREFAHVHPAYDGSLHLSLPLPIAEHAIEQGWAEVHPVALRGLIPMTIVMVYGPRDAQELDVVRTLVDASFEFAHPRD